jgi:hypothetical protein
MTALKPRNEKMSQLADLLQVPLSNGVDQGRKQWRTTWDIRQQIGAAHLDPREMEMLIVDLTDVAYPAARRLGVKSSWLDLAIQIRDALEAVASETQRQVNGDTRFSTP